MGDERGHSCMRNCKYANTTDACGLSLCGCNYLEKTGCSRVKVVYDILHVKRLTKRAKEMLKPENCPCFEEADKPRKRGRPKRKPDHYSFDTEKLRRLHGQGLTDKQIAEHFGVNQKTIGNWRRSIGLPTNGRLTIPQLDTEKVRQLYEQGQSDDSIARICGCSHQTVHNWRKREGLPPNFKGGKRTK